MLEESLRGMKHNHQFWSWRIVSPRHRMIDRIAHGALVAALIAFAVLVWMIQYEHRTPHLTMTATPPHDPVVMGRAVPWIIGIDIPGQGLRGQTRIKLLVGEGASVASTDPLWNSQDQTYQIPSFARSAHLDLHATITPHAANPVMVFAAWSDAHGATLSAASWTIPIEQPLLHMQLRARYWTSEGEQVGRGPHPPIPGETTKYEIVASAPYEGYTWSNVLVTGELGSNTAWDDFVPLGASLMRYDPITRRVIMQLKQWPITLDVPRDFGVVFRLRYAAPSNQEIENPVLIHGIIVRAQGPAQISQTLPDIRIADIGKQQ